MISGAGMPAGSRFGSAVHAALLCREPHSPAARVNRRFIRGLSCPAANSDRRYSLAGAMTPKKCIIVPGNGAGNVRDCNWYAWLEQELRSKGIAVALEDMPDPVKARENKWIPFIVNDLAGGPEELSECMVIGHSSGAAAAMRLAEEYKVYGIMLVAAYTSDLGDDLERASGYFSRPWQWDRMATNAGAIVQLASTDDPFLPISEQRKVGQEGLAGRCKYVEKDGKSHWFSPSKELLEEALWLVENGGHAS